MVDAQLQEVLLQAGLPFRECRSWKGRDG